MDLRNKTVLITGAAGGFGKALCSRLTDLDAQVIATDINLTELKKLADDDVKIHKLDVMSHKDFSVLCEWLKKNKISPDVWINNAGAAFPKAFTELSPTLFDRILDVNLKGVVNGTRAALSVMNPKHETWIVNIASCAGHMPFAYNTAYCASKFGVVGFTQSLQLELKDQKSKVRVMLVSPGFAKTDIMRSNVKEFEVPTWLELAVGTADQVARDIIYALKAGKEEIHPVKSAALLNSLHRYGPKKLYDIAANALIKATRK